MTIYRENRAVASFFGVNNKFLLTNFCANVIKILTKNSVLQGRFRI